jgi:hypothetical protein
LVGWLVGWLLFWLLTILRIALGSSTEQGSGKHPEQAGATTLTEMSCDFLEAGVILK